MNSGEKPYTSPALARSSVANGSGYKRRSAVAAARMASKTRGEGGNGFSFVLSLMVRRSRGCSPGPSPASRRTSGRTSERRLLDRILTALARPDSHDFEDVGHEDLPVANLAGLGHRLNRFDDRRHELVVGHDLDHDLRHEIHDVSGAPVNLVPAARSAEALDLRHGHSLDPDLGERLLDLIELGGPDDGLDALHDCSPSFVWPAPATARRGRPLPPGGPAAPPAA